MKNHKEQAEKRAKELFSENDPEGLAQAIFVRGYMEAKKHESEQIAKLREALEKIKWSFLGTDKPEAFRIAEQALNQSQ